MCVCTETIFCFPSLARGGSGHVAKLRIQYMEAHSNFKQNQSSSLVVDKGKGWGEQIRDKADELERGMQGDKIFFTRKCRLSL